MKNKKLVESPDFPPSMQMAASSLMGYSNALPECPSQLPDGTILDYSAVDETWKDVDFPEREEKPEARSMEESIMHDFHESKQSQATPQHIQKYMTRVQTHAAMVPTRQEAVAPAPVAAAEVVKFEKPVVEKMKKWAKKDESFKVWRTTSLDERSAEARANKQRRRSVEVAAAAKSAKAPSKPLGHALAPSTQPKSKGWGSKSKQPAVHALPGFHTWRAKAKKLNAAQ